MKNLRLATATLLCCLSVNCLADEKLQADSAGQVPVNAAGHQTSPELSPSTQGSPQTGVPLERAKGEKLATAIGYFARARSLLIAAVREFDKGLAIVDPNALIDSSMWRAGVMDRADELTRVLDPQPRATKSGIKYGNETVGIGDASKR